MAAPERAGLRKERVGETVDGFLEFLGGAEGDFLAGLDLDGLAGSRVAAHARGALADLQDAEAEMRTRSPFFRCLVIRSIRSLRMASAAFFDNS